MAVYKIESVGGSAYDAPDWFVDWVLLGMSLSEQCRNGRPTRTKVLAIWAPTIDFAASAIAFGFIRKRMLDHHRLRDDEGVPVPSTSRGQRIWFRIGETVRTAMVLDTDDRSVSTTMGKFLRSHIREIRTIPPWAKAEDSMCTLSVQTPSSHFKSLYRSLDYSDFMTEWALDVGVVGDLSTIDQELAVNFGPNDGTSNLDTFETTIRPFRAGAPFSWRSMIASDRGADPHESVFELPTLKILRGSLATSKYLARVRNGPVIALLGQEETQINPAVDAVMQCAAYAQPLRENQLNWRPPRGVEVHGFEYPND
jgi:hypothetical protein